MEEGLPPKKPSLGLQDSDYSWVEDLIRFRLSGLGLGFWVLGLGFRV